jgi:hypothetical protein
LISCQAEAQAGQWLGVGPHLRLRVGEVARRELLQRLRTPKVLQQRPEPAAEEVEVAVRELAGAEQLRQEHVVVEGRHASGRRPAVSDAASGLLRWHGRGVHSCVDVVRRGGGSLQRRRGGVHGAEAARVAAAGGGDRGGGGRGRRLHGGALTLLPSGRRRRRDEGTVAGACLLLVLVVAAVVLIRLLLLLLVDGDDGQRLLLELGVPVVLDVVVRPAGQFGRDDGPPAADGAVEGEDDPVLQFRVPAVLDIRPQVVEPPKPAALAAAVEPCITRIDHGVRQRRKQSRSKPTRLIA